MSSQIVLCAFFAIRAMAAPAGGASAVTIEVRLLGPLSSYSSKTGDPVEALVATPLCTERGALPAGLVASGAVRHVHKVGLGLVHETARMELEFTELAVPGGSAIPIRARLVAVDNARERVDGGGAIHGMRATGTMSNRLGGRLAFAALSHPAFFVPALALASGLVRFPEPEIVFEPGTELSLEALFPPSLGAVEACAIAEPPTTLGLRGIVDRIPAWSYTKRFIRPSDPVTLVFSGSASELERAFRAAGWTGSSDTTVRSGLRAMRALAEGGAYADAPMRTLLLGGEEPAASYQKGLNTLARRHHLRVWRRPELWQGRPVWASAATRDIGAVFSPKAGITHEIDNQVDAEREKVVRDLAFTGCVDGVAYIARRAPLRDEPGTYRQGIETDGRVAVVALNACLEPRRAAGNTQPAPLPAPGKLMRGARRVLLVARNHYLRDNIFWRSADAARLSVRAIRHWREQRSDERAARLHSEQTVRAAAAAWPEAPELLSTPVPAWPLVALGAPAPALELRFDPTP
jgi:hypothetical protein